MPTENPAQQAELAYQAESIRLAEGRLDQIHVSTQNISHMAFLLATAFAGLFGLLFVGSIPATGASVYVDYAANVLRLATFFFLFMSIHVGEHIVTFASIRAAGLHPDVSEHFALHYAPQKQAAARNQHLLNLYRDRIKTASQTLKEKADRLKSARDWLYYAFLCTMLRIALVLVASSI